jgi:short-subunit dehydrogenase
MKRLDGAIVLITGAGGGFGKEMIRQLLRAGSHLIVSDRDRRMLRETTEAALATANGAALSGKLLGYIEADLSSAAGADVLYRQSRAMTPHVDILVNNAGMGMGGPFHDIPQERWELLMQVNLLAPMRLTAKFLPSMIARRKGHIVNISSVAGLVGSQGLSAYSASKFGLRGFGEALAQDMESHGVDVTNIYPFFSRTPILDSEQFGTQPQTVPDSMIYDPEFIIAELINGIRRRQLHVYPGAIPKQIDFIRRMMPWALPLARRLFPVK